MTTALTNMRFVYLNSSSGHWAVEQPDQIDDTAKNLLVHTAWSLLAEQGVDVMAWKMWKKNGGAKAAADAKKGKGKGKGKGRGKDRGKGGGGKGGGGKGGGKNRGFAYRSAFRRPVFK